MEVGAAVDRGVTEKLAAQGVGAVTPSQGLVALERLLEEDRIQTAVVPIIGIVMWKSRARRPASVSCRRGRHHDRHSDTCEYRAH